KNKFDNPPIQGTPYEYHLKITNIGETIFKGARIKNPKFTFHGANLASTISSEIHIKGLNPKESCVTKLNQGTLKIDGASWFSLEIYPESDSQEVITYQHDKYHDEDEPYNILNEFGVTIYVEGKLASLQTTTNN